MSNLNDYCPIALTKVTEKCFKRLLPHIKETIPATLDQHQFAGQVNRLKEDALHTTVENLDKLNRYTIMLFLDFSSGLHSTT